MRRTMRFLRALVATNMKASFALRGAFWARAFFMFLNNFIFLLMWWVFFDEFEEVRGWRMADMFAIYGVAAGGYGLAVFLGAGVNELSRHIVEGDLDSFLSQPKNPLLHAVASQSEPSGVGDLASCLVLFAWSGYVSPATIPICVVACVAGGVVYLASAAMLHSLAFWLGNTTALSRQASQFILVFCLYPKTIFTGWLKVLLFTGLPAGFITFLPVDLVRKFDATTLFAVLGGAVLYSLLAFCVFRLGLKRYESGNRFGVRA